MHAFDMPGLVKGLEGLYREMWSDFERGTLPRPDSTQSRRLPGTRQRPDASPRDIEPHDTYARNWLERLRERHQYRPLTTADRFVSAEQLAAW